MLHLSVPKPHNVAVIESLKDQREARSQNVVTQKWAAAMASLVADVSLTARPSAIGVATGAVIQNDSANYDTERDLTSSGADQALAQSIVPAADVPVYGIALYIKRTGFPAGTLTVELQTDSSDLPSGTAVTNGTSVAISALSLDSSFDWILFPFTTPPTLTASTKYHIVLQSSGYTYDADVTAVILGTEESGPSYANGELTTYDGADWTVPGTAADAIFRVCQLVSNAFTALDGLLLSKTMTIRSAYGEQSVRLLSNFTVDDANDYITQIGIFNANSQLLAVANISFNKQPDEAVNVYWLVEFAWE